jgi:DNA (cytosine-5)-methyltransferase 1
MLTVGDLFSGIGGFSLGLERAGMRTAWFAEVDPYASAVLKKHWPEVPNHGDVRSIRAGSVERVDVLCGGFPCQPFSSAGKRGGTSDDRYLWPEMLRVIQELKPTWVCGENVTHIDRVALEHVVSDLEACGYETAPPLVIPACAVELDHRRDRFWFLGYSDSNSKSGGAINAEASRLSQVPADAECDGDGALGRDMAGAWREWESLPRNATGDAENHAVGVGADDGLPHRMDRLRCLGNAIVPQIAEIIGRAIVRAGQ